MAAKPLKFRGYECLPVKLLNLRLVVKPLLSGTTAARRSSLGPPRSFT